MSSTLSVSHRKPAGVAAGTPIHAVSQFGPGTTVYTVGPDGRRHFVPLDASGGFIVAANTHYIVRVGHSDDELRREVQKLRNRKKKLEGKVLELEQQLKAEDERDRFAAASGTSVPKGMRRGSKQGEIEGVSSVPLLGAQF